MSLQSKIEWTEATLETVWPGTRTGSQFAALKVRRVHVTIHLRGSPRVITRATSAAAIR